MKCWLLLNWYGPAQYPLSDTKSIFLYRTFASLKQSVSWLLLSHPSKFEKRMIDLASKFEKLILALATISLAKLLSFGNFEFFEENRCKSLTMLGVRFLFWQKVWECLLLAFLQHSRQPKNNLEYIQIESIPTVLNCLPT